MSVVASVDGSMVVLVGRLDVHSVADVRTALAEALEAGQGPLTVDLRAAEVMDATGLGVLIGGHRRAERSGRTLVFRAPSPRLMRLLASMRLHRILHLDQVPDLEDREARPQATSPVGAQRERVLGQGIVVDALGA